MIPSFKSSPHILQETNPHQTRNRNNRHKKVSPLNSKDDRTQQQQNRQKNIAMEYRVPNPFLFQERQGEEENYLPHLIREQIERMDFVSTSSVKSINFRQQSQRDGDEQKEEVEIDSSEETEEKNQGSQQSKTGKVQKIRKMKTVKRGTESRRSSSSANFCSTIANMQNAARKQSQKCQRQQETLASQKLRSVQSNDFGLSPYYKKKPFTTTVLPLCPMNNIMDEQSEDLIFSSMDLEAHQTDNKDENEMYPNPFGFYDEDDKEELLSTCLLKEDGDSMMGMIRQEILLEHNLGHESRHQKMPEERSWKQEEGEMKRQSEDVSLEKDQLLMQDFSCYFN